MDFAAIGAAVTSLRMAGDIAKGLVSLHTMAEVQSKAIELNEKIIDAQHRVFEANAAQTELIERVRQLEGQIARMKDWDTQKQRYKLASPHRGATVYALKKDMNDGEPPHYLCTSCFKKGEPSILQIGSNKDAWTFWGCPICKSQAMTGYRGPDLAKYAEDIAEPT